MNMDFFHFDDSFAPSSFSPSNGCNNGKRQRDDGDETECEFESAVKKISTSLEHEDDGFFGFGPQLSFVDHVFSIDEQAESSAFHNYRDFSTEADLDALTPLTPPGRVPNFPAKMHAILTREDLADIIAWMPHGRAWRVLKPREFEVRVLPVYFEHAKFSSFIRQANGWGFRRITQGRGRNSYYHPLFLRGLSHLCKRMKRPGVSEKQAVDPEYEPDLFQISEVRPVPEKPDSESIMLNKTLQAGPKARVPFSSSVMSASVPGNKPSKQVQKLTPFDQHALAAFQQSLGASESQLTKVNNGAAQNASRDMMSSLMPQVQVANTMPFMAPFNVSIDQGLSPVEMACQMSFMNPSVAGTLDSSSPAAQFAAGFAAATAFSQQQFQAIIAQMQQQHSQGTP